MIDAIEVRDLLGHPGSSREVPIRGTLEGLGFELADIPADAPIEGSLLLESVVEGIVVSGPLAGRMRLRCARCLREFDRPLLVQVHELFSPNPDPKGDEYPLDPEGALDPEQMVRDAVGLELPFSPLCRPDCLGLCPECGGDRNLGECPGDHPTMDARWATLDDLFPTTNT